jgi:sporulation protein YlmC with PRC-barrel domain
MYARVSKLLNLPIVSLQTGEAVAWTRAPILETTSLEIIAFRCELGGRSGHSLVLLAADIRRLTSESIVIDSEEELADPADVVRLRPLIQAAYTPIGKGVFTDAGHKLGTVEDYTVNLQTNRVQKLYVRQSVLQAWIGSSLLIDRTQIVEISARRIIVRDTTIKTPILPTDPVPGT